MTLCTDVTWEVNLVCFVCSGVQLEASSQRLSSQLEATIQTLEGEKDRSAEWKGEAEKYQVLVIHLLQVIVFFFGMATKWRILIRLH